VTKLVIIKMVDCNYFVILQTWIVGQVRKCDRNQ